MYEHMEHLGSIWSTLLPTRYYRISYDRLVSETRSVVEPVLDQLGLPWSDEMLRPENNPNAVMTASQLQLKESMAAYTQRRSNDYFASYVEGSFKI